MTFDVAFIPSEAAAAHSPVYIVIDVLRATSTIVTLFDRGCPEVRLTDDVLGILGDSRPDPSELLICAEDLAGNRLGNADFSPSLLQVAQASGIDRVPTLMQTTNGTVAIHTLTRRGAQEIYLGCMLNAKAVAEQAVGRARQLQTDLVIVCAGRGNGTLYTIDDVYCAATLLGCATQAASGLGEPVLLNDSAKLAMMTRSVFSDAVEAFAASASGNTMRKIHCEQDIELCARLNLSHAVPRVCGSNPQGQILVTNCG